MGGFTFNARERATLDAAADCIVPPDIDPGAAVSGAGDFILRLLNNELVSLQQDYIAGLDGIEQEALAATQHSFAYLSFEHQVNVLKGIEADDVSTPWLVSPPDFFKMLVEHVLEGFYADPENGGNLDGTSWKMVGYRSHGAME